MKTYTLNEFFEAQHELIDEAMTEPVEIAIDDHDSVVMIAKSLFDEFILENAPHLR